MAIVEVCAEGADSAIAAGLGGADRVELCLDRAIGGITPPVAAMRSAVAGGAAPVMILVRPRGGNFVFSDAEAEEVAAGIDATKAAGALGVVLGALTPDGRVDRARLARWLDRARPLSVTFHKAIDEAVEPDAALDDLIALGVDRVLTSGGAPRASDGHDRLARWVRRVGGRIAVMAGGSIRIDEIASLVDVGITEIHLGSGACRDESGLVDATTVRRIVDQARSVPIYHLTTVAEWVRAQAEGVYRAESLATEGFIHASTRGQLLASANRFFAGRPDLVALRIDPRSLGVPVRREYSPHSPHPFPHVFGPIAVAAVVEVLPIPIGADGRFAAPG